MNLADLARDAATDFPAKAALIFHGRPVAFADLDDRIDLTAAALASLGVRPGDRVGLMAGNVPEFVTTLYGALRAGAVACPLNVMLTPEELGYILADAGAKVVVSEMSTVPVLLAVRDRLSDLETIVVIGGPPAPARTVSLEEALLTSTPPPDVQAEPGDLAVIAYTAGTTASPKGAMLTHRNLTSNLEQMGAVPELALVPDDIVLVVLPLFHIYALNVVLGLTLKTGATAVLVDRFDPEETLQLIERHAITVVFGAPPMYSAWLELADSGQAIPDLSTVRLAVSGAAALPAEVLERFKSAFGITVWEGYGLTEASPAVTTNAMGDQAKPGSIGKPLPGVEVRLVDEDGDDAEDGDPGEVLVKGPNVFAGYWNKPEATAEVMDGEWLRTGDVAYRDEDGYLFLVDRKKDLINVSGFNVYPKEVEEAIERHPGVAEAAVIGMPDERTGEAVQAWVVPKEGRAISERQILDFLHGYLARFKWPKEIQIVEELPHHVTGKVLRRALRGEELLGQEEGPEQASEEKAEPDTEPEAGPE